MGTYTVFIRQDQADCRMGNYTCEYAPANGTGGSDAGVGAGGAGGTAGNTTCTVPVARHLLPTARLSFDPKVLPQMERPAWSWK